jgi:hypothetical protein
MNLSVEIKIHQTVKNTLGEDEIDSDIAYQSRLNNKNALEGELRNFLRRSVAEKRKPEETLDQAIKIIRSQPR